jgi:rRNA maturation endonuclease Nob1
VIDKIQSADYSQPLTIGDLTLFFRPLNYKEITANSILQFEQQKTAQILSDAEATDESKVQQLNRMMKKIMELTVNVLSQSIREIRTPSAVVQEHQQVLEFIKNCDRASFNKIKDHMAQMREVSELKPLDIACSSCQHKYEQAFTMDNARFFVSDS